MKLSFLFSFKTVSYIFILMCLDELFYAFLKRVCLVSSHNQFVLIIWHVYHHVRITIFTPLFLQVITLNCIAYIYTFAKFYLFKTSSLHVLVTTSIKYFGVEWQLHASGTYEMHICVQCSVPRFLQFWLLESKNQKMNFKLDFTIFISTRKWVEKMFLVVSVSNCDTTE